MAGFNEIDNARKTLALREKASMQDIKDAYRQLAHKYHPDKCKKPDCQQKFREIDNAYKIIMAYCAGYKFSFEKDDVLETKPDKKYAEYMKRFYEDWLI